MEQKVYISYSRTDKEKVYEIKEWLETHTTASFIMCQHDVEGLPEQYVMDAIKGINECDVFLFMLSDNSQFSERPLMELSFASRKYIAEGKKVYIIKIEDCETKDSFLFRWGQYKLFNWNSEFQIYDLIRKFSISNSYNYLGDPPMHKILINQKYGFVNHKGEIVIPCKWDNVGEFNEGLAAVADGSGKEGFLDTKGNRVIPCTWKCVGSFCDGMTVVQDFKDNYGVINRYGDIIIPVNHKSLEYIGDGMFKEYVENGYYQLLNDRNERLTGRFWKNIGYFSHGLCPVSDDKYKYGFIDRNNHEVISCWWSSADSFSEGLALVRDDKSKYGFVDTSGAVVIPCYRDKLNGFHDGLAAFRENGKYGFINKDDEVVIKPVWRANVPYYVEDMNFYDGRCAIVDDKMEIGFIDKSGRLAIQCKWKKSESFHDGTAWVWVENTWKLINKNGEYV